MKICYIFSNFHLAHITGQPATIFKLARYAAKKEKKVYLISNTPHEVQSNEDGIKFFLIKGLGDFKTYFLNILKLIKYLRTVKPDIIHVHGYLLTIFVWILNRFFNTPLVCSVCEALDIVNIFYKKFIIFCLTYSELIFVTSEYIKRQLIKSGVPSGKIIVVRIGLDEKFLIERNGSLSDTDILYYGDSIVERGFDIIFHLAQRLPHLKFKILLRWEGENCSHELEQMKKMPNVIIRHYPYSESLEQLILKSKLVVLPYRWIGVRPPLSLVESMGLGKCVVTSTMDGNEELIKNWFNGIIANFDKLDDITSEISVLIKNDKQWEDIGRQAKMTIKQMYSSAEYDKILSEYSAVLKLKGRLE